MSTRDFPTRIAAAMDALLARPEAAARDEGTAGVIVALSGGPDSVALLLALRDWATARGRHLAAAHFNHQLRGPAAEADVTFCRNLCADLDVPLFVDGSDPRPVARQRGRGLEEAGRHLRRAFCEGLLATQPGHGWIATGHHRDDQTETVVMRLFRGTGPDGLRGIRPVAGAWLHPLLGEDRAAILAFLAERGQPWRADETNTGGDNTRARLRRELLPLVQGIFGAGSLDGPARLAELVTDELDLLDALTAEWLGACRSEGDALDVPALLALEPARARRVLRAWLAGHGADRIERVHVANIRLWLADGESGSRLDLPEGVILERDFDVLRVQGAPAPLRFAGDYRIVVGKGRAPAAPAAAGPATGAGARDDESTWSLTCPADALQGNLQVRNWRQGDRFQPFGLQGTKKLSDLLREHRVTRDERESVLVVADGEGILWVVGVARAERTRLLPTTTRTVTISVVKRIQSNQEPGPASGPPSNHKREND